MIRSGTINYSDPELFQADLSDTSSVLALTGPGPFKAKRTWIALKNLHLMQIEETLPRIAFVSPSSDRVYVSFPSNPIFNSIWGGVALRAREIVFHGRDVGTHDRTMGVNCWGVISLEARALAAHVKNVADSKIAPPRFSEILRPARSDAMRLIHLHRKACRLAAKEPNLFSHKEVARALENELLEALVPCLIAKDAYRIPAARAKKLKAMADFETAVREEMARPLTIPAICQLIGVAERTLRSYCSETLGMSPSQYIRLRRLNLARAALQHADPASTPVKAVACHFQFGEAGRFSMAYRELFGEAPSTTLASACLKSS